MTKIPGGLSILMAGPTFIDRLDENNEISKLKGGTYDGVNHQIEFYANVFDAVVFTAVDTLTSAALEKFLKNFTDVFDISASLADLAADKVRDTVSEEWYNNPNEFNDMQKLNPFNEFDKSYHFDSEDFKSEFSEPITNPLPGKDDLIPFDPNNPPLDTDGDGIPDNVDPYPSDGSPDSDGDGIPDNSDPYPSDGSPDSDGDGIPDNSDPLPNDPSNGNGNKPKTGNTTAPRAADPLVLDLDKDGMISTTSLADSSAYFDLTGDGIKEKVGWIQANDGLVAYDKDDNGKIDGINEVFGNQTTSGFDELGSIADSNYDGVINRKDELYSRLKVWNDTNQDGSSQIDELVSLSEAGVKSINLNAVSTNIEVNGNLITEASKYTDSEGNLELIADLELEFDGALTTVDTTTIPDYTEHPDSSTLPFLRAYGLLYDSTIAYNIDENFRELAKEMASDVSKVANNFEEYMDGWSGYNKMQKDLQTKYNLTDTPKLGDLDRKVWTYERFIGETTFRTGIESRLDSTAKNMQTGGSDTAGSGIYNTAVVHDVYDDFTNRNKAFFSLKAFYPELLEGNSQYQRGIDEFVITDQDALSTKVVSYINNPDNTLEAKLYLVEQMNVLQETFLDFNVESITSKIDDTLVKNLVSAVYNDTLNTSIYNTNGIYANNSLIVGTNQAETLDITAVNSTTLAAEGNDKILGSNTNDIYIYRNGDGADTLGDRGGNDTLTFSDILKENVIIKSDANDLVIAVAEDGKTFGELSNKVTITNWIDSANRVENIIFADGTSPDFSQLIVDNFITELSDTIDLTNSSDTVDMKGGDDVVNALGGDDTIDGGLGNDTIDAGTGNDTLLGSTGDDTLKGGFGDDTYIYNLNDGNDIIIDSSGNDTLIFGDSITLDMLSSKTNGNDLIISLGNGESITLENYILPTNIIENIILNDGTHIDIASLQSPTDDDDTLVYGDSSITVDTLDGNDNVTTGSADDTIDGGAGNDTINSGSGDDTLTGNIGSDTLIGGLGDDTYIFNVGDGHDTIIDAYNYGYNNFSSKDAGNDTIVFGEGVIQEDISVTIIDSDIVISINDNDSMTIKNATNPNSAIENIKLHDGTTLKIQDLQSATQGNDTLVFGNSDVTLDALGGDDNVTTGSGNDSIDGGTGNDTIITNDGSDNLLGGLDDDTLISGRGDDTLSGGAGTDTLKGGLGNDTYVFNRGDGKDTIYDNYYYGSAGNDTLTFGEEITQDDLIAVASGNDMIVAIKEDDVSFTNLSDKVTIKDWLNVNNRVENIALSDGSSVNFADIQGATDEDDYLTFGDEGVNVDALGGDDVIITGSGNDTIDGGSGNDSITSNAGDDTLNAGEGNDTIIAGYGNDILRGGAGNDTLKAEYGNDTLSGGTGTDRLEGGYGDDTYLFSRGDGVDTVIDTKGNDTLQLGVGVTQADLIIKAQGNDLVVALKEDGKAFDELSDKITLSNWLHLSTRVENIVLNDGSSINLVDIQNGTNENDYLIFGDEGVNVTLLDGDDVLISGSGNDTVDGGAGNDTINTNAGNDTINAGTGDDTVNSGSGHDIINAGDGTDTVDAGLGDDTITGSTGDDYLKGGLGNDTYIFNIGDGKDTVTDIGGTDTLRFGDGVTSDDIVFKQDGYNLIATIKEDGKNFNEFSDKITLENWFNGDNNVENLEFSDGTTLGSSDIASLFVNVNIEDTLFSKAGAIMRGEVGDDIYVYNRGDFKVIVDDYATKDSIEIDAGTDTLMFSTGINKADVTIGINGDNLIIEVIGAHDTYDELKDYVVIKDWKNENRGIESIIFSDGEVLEITKTETFESVTFDNSWASNRYYVYGGEDNLINGSTLADKIEAGSGDDTINAGNGNDIVYGGNGEDTIDAGLGDDIVEGGKGNDYLRDASGNDTYVYGRGDGKDIIYDTSGSDTLRFADGITKDDLVVKQYGNTMVVGLKDGDTSFYRLEDKITIRDWFVSGTRIETFQFTDGSTIDVESIAGLIGTAKNDTISGLDSRDDNINAQDGDDIVNSGVGNDTITGGKGNDTLTGGSGNDTYVFNRGDGKDSIFDESGLDTIRFGLDITAQDIIYEAEGDNLIVALKEEDKTFDELKDKITIADWHKDLTNRVEVIQFDNGTKLSISDLVTNPTEEADNLTYGDEDNIIDALAGDDVIYAGAGNDTVNAGEGNDTIYAGNDNDTINGNEGDDTLWGNNGDDVLKGGDGDDTIYGDHIHSSRGYAVGQDILEGGKGNDILWGGGGDDTYIFNRGDGEDYIYDYYLSSGGAHAVGGNDTLKFGEGITQDDLILKQSGNQLIVALKEDGKTFDELSDKITLENFSYNTIEYHETRYGSYNSFFGIEKIEFNDGSSWDEATMVANIRTDDNDIIFGQNGNDTIEGGKGDDTLYGRLGDDTYIFNRGDGKDTIFDDYGTKYGDSNSGNDTLKFGEGIVESDLIIKKDANNVLIGIKEDGKTFDELADTIIVQDWYNNNNRVENFVLNDGTSIDLSFLFAPTEEADNLTYGDEDNIIDALAGDDVIYAGAGNDTVNAGEGNDTIYAGNDNDTINGNEGDDTLWGNNGDDVLKGGDGDDTIYGDHIHSSRGYAVGQDILEGGKGNDILWGGGGDDTYIFNRGDGEDYIYDYYLSSGGAHAVGGNDTLKFGEGITQDDLILKQSGNQLIVALKEDGKTFDELSDKITLENFSYNTIEYHETRYGSYNSFFGIEKIEFNDGSSWDEATMVANIRTDDNDIIFGQNGNDTIEGGKGDDTLYGRLGDDTYIFNRGDGKDTIFDDYGTKYGDSNSGNDTLKFGEGITTDDVIFYMDEANLVVDYANSDQVTITSQNSDNNAIEKVELSNGSYLTNIDIQRITTELLIYADENSIDISNPDTIRNNAEIKNIFTSAWKDAATGGEFTPPLVLDLNHNDTTSTSLESSNAYFDYDSDGDREHTAWSESGDAILAMDINNDGAITNGGELFGNFTKLAGTTLATDGYAALAQYDSNSDNIIDKNDTKFNDLLLWKDTNQDGKSTKSELININLSTVTAIHLSRENGITFTEFSENGNLISNETIFDTNTSTTGTVRDVWFKYDSTDSVTGHNDIYRFNVGAGNYLIDDNDLSSTGVDKLILGSGIVADQVLMKWDRATDDLIIGVREHSEDDTPLNSLDDQIRIKDWFKDSGLVETIELADGTTFNRDSIYQQLLSARENSELTLRVLDEGDTLTGGDYNDVLYGASGDESLSGKDGDDYLKGQEGDDLLNGGKGDDTLNGELGDDTLVGESGDDYYLYEKGSGRDTIIDSAGADTISFGDGISRQDVLFKVSGDDMLLTFAYDSNLADEQRDSILITNYKQSGFEIENLEFSNGENYSIEEIIDKNINHAPTTIFAESSYTLSDVSLQTGIILARDVDGDSLNYTVSTLPEHGEISINEFGIWTYTSNDQYKGLDSAEVTIDDGNGLSTTKILNFEILITNINTNPTVAEAESNIILQDIREQSGDVGASDEDGDTLTYTLTTDTQHGTISVDENGTWIYKTDSTYIGTDVAVITVDDGNGGSVTKTLHFNSKVSSPTINTIAYALQEDNISTDNLNVSNPIGGVLTYEVLTPTSNGAFTLDTNGAYTYTPIQDYNGNDEVIIKVTNEYGLSTTSTLTFDIEAVNDIPTIANDNESFTLHNIREVEGQVIASDIDNATLTYSVATQATNGEVSVDDKGNWHYKANGSFNGNDSAVISVDDGTGATVTSVLNFSVDGYIYEGKDLVIDEASGNDTLLMDNINKDELSFEQKVDDLQITVVDGGIVTLKNYFTNANAGVETLHTAQGDINLSRDVINNVKSRWWFSSYRVRDSENHLVSGSSYSDFISGNSGNDIAFGNSKYDYILGKAGNDLLIGGTHSDTINGGDGDDNLYGDSGNDNLYGADGNDFIIGSQGSDFLSGSKGNDWLSGGSENDTLKGGSGNDIFHFNTGDGSDTVYDGDESFFDWFTDKDGGNDTISFGKDITIDDVSFIMKNGDLSIQYSENDFVKVKDQDKTTQQIERIELEDGNFLTNNDIDLVIQQINSYGSDNGMGTISNNDIQNNADLMNIVSSAWNT